MKIIFLYLIFALSALAAEVDLKKQDLPHDRVITITGHPDYPPIIWFNKTANQFQGLAVELMEMALKDANVKAKFINVETWARAQEEVKNGRIDMLLPPYKTQEREIFYNYYADAFLMDETVVFVKKGNEFKLKNLADLTKYTGVAIINDSFGNEFDKFEKEKLHLTRLTTTEQCFKFVDKDRARFIVAGLHSGLTAMAKLNLSDKFTYLPNKIIVTGLYAPVSIKSAWNTPSFNKFLKKKFSQYTSDGTIKKLEKKYFAILKQELKQKH